MLWTVPLAYVVDLLLGDPRQITHPVIFIGRLIAFLENAVYGIVHSGSGRRALGTVVVCLTVGVSYATTWVLVRWAGWVHPMVGWMVAVWLVSTTIAQTSLAQAAVKVQLALERNEIQAARQRTQEIVGRDTEHLEEGELVRAAVETVAENTVDGVTAPIFYAFLGGAPLAMAYRAVNTLDSMLGYKNERYTDFGWAAARLDGAFNYVPARLTGIVLPIAARILGCSPMGTVRTILSDARKHPSPNSGIMEAGFAGALKITLGGRNVYGGNVSYRAVMGTGCQPLQAERIRQAVKLMKTVSALFALVGFAAFVVWVRRV